MLQRYFALAVCVKVYLHSVIFVSKLSLSTTKLTKRYVRPATTQIILGIRQAWIESSLFTWRSIGSLDSHWAHSEDSDQTGLLPRLIWVFAGRTGHFVGFVMHRLNWDFLITIAQLVSEVITKQGYIKADKKLSDRWHAHVHSMHSRTAPNSNNFQYELFILVLNTRKHS